MVTRLVRAWRALSPEQRFAAVAAVSLFVTMLLPWYQQNGVDKTGIVSEDLDAFAVFSFIEAAILLVAVSVLVLLFARAEGRSFHVPGSDGAVVTAGGIWTALLLILRLFDKPGVSAHGVAANVGVQWGIFFALGAAGLLTWAGARMRAAERPEPPLMRRGPRPPARGGSGAGDGVRTNAGAAAPPAAAPKAAQAAVPAPAAPNAAPKAAPKAAPAAVPARPRKRDTAHERERDRQLSFDDAPTVVRQPPERA